MEHFCKIKQQNIEQQEVYFQYSHYSIWEVKSVFYNVIIKHFCLDFLVELCMLGLVLVLQTLFVEFFFFERETQQETKRLVWIIFPFGMRVHLFVETIQKSYVLDCFLLTAATHCIIPTPYYYLIVFFKVSLQFQHSLSDAINEPPLGLHGCSVQQMKAAVGP